MKNGQNAEISGLFKILMIVYLAVAFGAYFATFVLSRLARVKDLLGL